LARTRSITRAVAAIDHEEAALVVGLVGLWPLRPVLDGDGHVRAVGREHSGLGDLADRDADARWVLLQIDDREAAAGRVGPPTARCRRGFDGCSAIVVRRRRSPRAVTYRLSRPGSRGHLSRTGRRLL